jgi:hypothetical protein
MTLTLKWCRQWVDCYWGTTIQEILYRCKACWVRKLSDQQWLHTKKAKTKQNKTKIPKTKWTMSPTGRTVSCKIPPYIRTCIDSRPPIGNALTEGVKRWNLYCFKKIILRHRIIKWLHSVKIFNWSGKHSIRAFIWDTTRNLTLGYTIFDPWSTRPIDSQN